MRKLFNLIINEYIKSFAKASTLVMFALIALMAIGFNLLMFISNRDNGAFYGQYADNDTAFYNQQIQDLKNDVISGSETEMMLEQYTFLRDHAIPYNDPDWRLEAADTAFSLKYSVEMMEDANEQKLTKQRADDIIAAIIADDWKTFMQQEIAFTNRSSTLSPEEKEVTLWALNFRLENNIPQLPAWMQDSSDDDWRDRSIDTLVSSKTTYLVEASKALVEQNTKLMQENLQNALIEQHRLEHNIEVFTSSNTALPYYDMNFWSSFQQSTSTITIISVLVIILTGSLIASEFSTGTIKFLLINPVKRWKIFVAKYITLLTMILLMLVVFYIFNALVSSILFGFRDLNAPHLYVSGDVVKSTSSWLFMAQKYLLGSIGLVVMATLAFAISALARNSAVAIGISLLCYLSGSALILILHDQFGMDWPRYLIFANTDLDLIAAGNSPFYGHTVSFAVIVIVIHLIVFLLTAWDAFIKRDV